jgi:hypothetical protein
MTTLLSPEIDIVGKLTGHCDRCGAAAKLAVALTSGGELAFCGHHANRHHAGIMRVASKVRVEDGFSWTSK